METSILNQLMQTIDARRGESAEKSYTAKLLQGGLPKISEKIMEEAQELIEAAGESGTDGREHCIYEAADLVYHLLVLLAHQRISLEEIELELARRFGISGLQEKANRNK
jgi:phosphoribosyl-ATP pyrophosphohydrolase